MAVGRNYQVSLVWLANHYQPQCLFYFHQCRCQFHTQFRTKMNRACHRTITSRGKGGNKQLSTRNRDVFSDRKWLILSILMYDEGILPVTGPTLNRSCFVNMTERVGVKASKTFRQPLTALDIFSLFLIICRRINELMRIKETPNWEQ